MVSCYLLEAVFCIMKQIGILFIMHIYNGSIVYLIYIMYICVSHTYIMRACVYLIYMYI